MISNTSNTSNLSNTGKKDKKPSLYIYNKITNYTLNNISTINAAKIFLSCLKKAMLDMLGVLDYRFLTRLTCLTCLTRKKKTKSPAYIYI